MPTVQKRIFIIKTDTKTRIESKKAILISERKFQGSKEDRMLQGKEPQATGNAVERAGKNLNTLSYMYNEDLIFPYIIFCDGCDFVSEEELPELLNKATHLPIKLQEKYKKNFSSSYKLVHNKLYDLNYQSLNELHLEVADYRNPPATIYARWKQWTIAEMVKTMTLVAEASVNYYFGTEIADSILNC